jgi:hypothetical protein
VSALIVTGVGLGLLLAAQVGPVTLLIDIGTGGGLIAFGALLGQRAVEER